MHLIDSSVMDNTWKQDYFEGKSIRIWYVSDSIALEPWLLKMSALQFFAVDYSTDYLSWASSCKYHVLNL